MKKFKSFKIYKILIILLSVLLLFVSTITLQNIKNAYALTIKQNPSEYSNINDNIEDNIQKFNELIKAYSGFEDKKISKIKTLTDFNGSLFLDLECEPIGYLIVNYETMIPFEYASNSVSPYYYAEGNLIYGAPTYYYKQTQTSLTKNTAEKFYLQEIISNEEVILNENTFNNFKAYNIQTIKALEDSNITTNENLINPYGQSTPYGGYYIENYEYVSKIEDFAYNHSGICTYVAAAIILYYTQRQFGGNFINTSFMTNNGFTVDLVNELLSIAKSLGVGNATHAVEFKKVMQKYTETRVPNATHYSMALSTALNIDLCFRDNKPVMLCGNFQDVSSSSGKVNHTIVAFGRSETVSGIYKNRYYHVNYGWRGYTDVTIMDNIFLNPIGSMYNLNPLG